MKFRVLSIATVVLGLAAPACGSAPPVERCGEIPPGGCPLGRGGTCGDATCVALYDCVGGEWTEAETCDNPVGGGGAGGAGGGVGTGGADCVDVEIDTAGESTRCTPDLGDPDCPVAAAFSCQPCTTGCVDFFLCTAEGWVDVAFCDDDGELVVVPR